MSNKKCLVKIHSDEGLLSLNMILTSLEKQNKFLVVGKREKKKRSRGRGNDRKKTKRKKREREKSKRNKEKKGEKQKKEERDREKELITNHERRYGS